MTKTAIGNFLVLSSVSIFLFHLCTSFPCVCSFCVFFLTHVPLSALPLLLPRLSLLPFFLSGPFVFFHPLFFFFTLFMFCFPFLLSYFFFHVIFFLANFSVTLLTGCYYYICYELVLLVYMLLL